MAGEFSGILPVAAATQPPLKLERA